MVQNQVEKQNQEHMMFILTWVCLKISLRQTLVSRQLIAYRVSSQGIRTGNLEDWNKERGKANVGMHYFADNSSGQLGLGPTGDTLRSHVHRHHWRRQKSSAFIRPLVAHWSGLPLVKGTVIHLHIQICACVLVAEWFHQASCAEDVLGRRRRDFCFQRRQVALRSEFTADAATGWSMKWVEKMGEATEGFDAEE